MFFVSPFFGGGAGLPYIQPDKTPNPDETKVLNRHPVFFVWNLLFCFQENPKNGCFQKKTEIRLPY